LGLVPVDGVEGPRRITGPIPAGRQARDAALLGRNRPAQRAEVPLNRRDLAAEAAFLAAERRLPSAHGADLPLQRRDLAAIAALFAAKRGDLSTHAAHLTAQAGDLPRGVERFDHAIAPLLRRGVERAIRAADLPRDPLRGPGRRALETFDVVAARGVEDAAAGAGDPLARTLAARRVAHALRHHAHA